MKHMMTTDQVLTQADMKHRTLMSWVQQGLLPKPLMVAKPTGRGRHGVWPSWVMERIFRIQEMKEESFQSWADSASTRIERGKRTDPRGDNVIRVLTFPEINLSTSGHVELIKEFAYTHNLVTNDGDIYYAIQGAGETPTAGEVIEYYWAPSVSTTAGTGNIAGNAGADSDCPDATALGSITIGEFVKQCQFIGNLIVHDGAVVQNGFVGILAPTQRFGQLIVKNESGDVFETDDVEMHQVLNPIIPEVQ